MGVSYDVLDENRHAALLSREYWDAAETRVLIQEAHELTAIFVASQKTARKRLAERRERAQVEQRIRKPHRR